MYIYIAQSASQYTFLKVVYQLSRFLCPALKLKLKYEFFTKYINIINDEIIFVLITYKLYLVSFCCFFLLYFPKRNAGMIIKGIV
jgi:hypothetical protein